MQKGIVALIAVIGLFLSFSCPNVEASQGHASASSLSGFVNLLDLKEGKGVHSVAWSPDGSKIAVGDDSGIMSIYDSSSGVLLKQFTPHKNAVSAISWSKQGRVATGSYDNTVKIWDSSDWKQVGDTIQNHTNQVWDVAWSADGNELTSSGKDGKIFTYSPDAKYLSEMETTVTGLARAVSWEPAGDFLVGFIQDDFTNKPIIYKWSASSGKIKKQLAINVTAYDISWDSKGSLVGVTLENGSVMLIEPDLFVPQRFIPVSASALYTIAWGTGDSKNEMVLAGNDKTIYTATSIGNKTGNITNAHSDIIMAIALSPNGTMYASGSRDAHAKVWGDPHPQIVWHVPVSDAKNVSVMSNITIKFDRKMDEPSLRAAMTLQTALFNILVRNNNTYAVIEPQGKLAYEARFTVSIKSSAKGMVGGNMSADFSFMFTTENSPASPALDIPWLWVGVAVLVILIIIIIAVLASRRRAGKRILPQRERRHGADR